MITRALFLLGALGFGALGFDWDEILMVLMGFAGVAVIYLDHRRDREHGISLREHAERLARLEAVVSDDHGLAERIAAMEFGAATLEDMTERIDELVGRVATIEARIDYQPVRATKRRADGKFAKPDEEK